VTEKARVLGDFFKKHAVERAAQEAILCKGRRFTWAEYDKQTDLAAAGLIKLGVKRGDRVGIYVPNWPEFLFTYMGAAKMGAVSVPVSWRFTPQEIKFIVNNAGISVLVMADGFMGMDFIKNLESIRGELPTLKHVVLLSEGKAASGMIPYQDFLKEPGPELASFEGAVESSDPVLFLFTSGTTGVPKAAVLTHRNLIAYSDGQLIASGFESSGETLLLNIPLNHVGGAVMAVIACLNSGNKLVMMDMFDPEKTLQLIQDEKVTVMGQVPAQYAMALPLRPHRSHQEQDGRDAAERLRADRGQRGHHFHPPRAR
jgi:fatty-acyl-CoA synthase